MTGPIHSALDFALVLLRRSVLGLSLTASPPLAHHARAEMTPRVVGATLIPIGVMLIWSSDATARMLVAQKRLPFPVSITRAFYVVGGIVCVLAGLKLVIWPEPW